MEQNANPPITQQNQSPATPPPHKDSFVFRDRAAAVHSFFKRVSLEIIIGAILLLVLLGVANYFNVIPLSQNYPQIMGWLPYQRESAVTNLPNQQKVGSLLGNFSASLSPTFSLPNTLPQNAKPTSTPQVSNNIEREISSGILSLIKEAKRNGIPDSTLLYLLKQPISSKRSAVLSRTITIEAEGEIVNLNKSECNVNNKSMSCIKLLIKKNDETVSFLYSTDALPGLKIVKIVNNQAEEQINIDDLKVNDKIRVLEIFDLKNNKFLESRITKL